MDRIKRIEYTENLVREEDKLKRNLYALKEMIQCNQTECSHFYIKTGVNDDGFTCYDCLYCGNRIFGRDNEKIAYIDAIEYKSCLYGNGETEESRMNKMIEIRNLYKKICKAYPDYNEENILLKLIEQIAFDDKIMWIGSQKKIGRR